MKSKSKWFTVKCRDPPQKKFKNVATPIAVTTDVAEQTQRSLRVSFNFKIRLSAQKYNSGELK